jgi:choline dehydrogenase-like flavoprotein
VGARVLKEGRPVLVNAAVFIVAAGAVNSAALLLKSANSDHPDGLANSSGLVGRNFMSHNSSVVMALSPLKTNPTVFQKTLAIHDFYHAGSSSGKPLGAIQLRGKVKEEMLRNKPSPIVRLFGKQIARRSIDLWVMTEDLPHPESRVTVDRDGRIHLARRLTNGKAHVELIRTTRQMMRRAGFPLCFVDPRGVSAIQHQCGTARFGTDPRSSVLDPWCKAHDLPNLYVIDSSFFPSSAAVNPSLTILAQALRASEHLKEQLRA